MGHVFDAGFYIVEVISDLGLNFTKLSNEFGFTGTHTSLVLDDGKQSCIYTTHCVLLNLKDYDNPELRFGAKIAS